MRVCVRACLVIEIMICTCLPAKQTPPSFLSFQGFLSRAALVTLHISQPSIQFSSWLSIIFTPSHAFYSLHFFLYSINGIIQPRLIVYALNRCPEIKQYICVTILYYGRYITDRRSDTNRHLNTLEILFVPNLLHHHSLYKWSKQELMVKTKYLQIIG